MVHSNKAKVSQSQSSVGQCWEGSCCYQLLLLRCSVLAWSSILDLFFTWLYTTAWSLVTGIRTNKQTCAYGSLERLSKQKAGYSLVSKNILQNANTAALGCFSVIWRHWVQPKSSTLDIKFAVLFILAHMFLWVCCDIYGYIKAIEHLK